MTTCAARGKQKLFVTSDGDLIITVARGDECVDTYEYSIITKTDADARNCLWCGLDITDRAASCDCPTCKAAHYCSEGCRHDDWTVYHHAECRNGDEPTGGKFTDAIMKIKRKITGKSNNTVSSENAAETKTPPRSAEPPLPPSGTTELDLTKSATAAGITPPTTPVSKSANAVKPGFIGRVKHALFGTSPAQTGMRRGHDGAVSVEIVYRFFATPLLQDVDRSLLIKYLGDFMPIDANFIKLFNRWKFVLRVDSKHLDVHRRQYSIDDVDHTISFFIGEYELMTSVIRDLAIFIARNREILAQ